MSVLNILNDKLNFFFNFSEKEIFSNFKPLERLSRFYLFINRKSSFQTIPKKWCSIFNKNVIEKAYLKVLKFDYLEIDNFVYIQTIFKMISLAHILIQISGFRKISNSSKSFTIFHYLKNLMILEDQKSLKRLFLNRILISL